MSYFYAPVLIHSSLPKAEVAKRISESILGGIPLVDAESHFGYRVFDEVPVHRSMRPILGHYVDLLGDGPAYQLDLRCEMRICGALQSGLVDAMDFMVELLNLIDGMRAERGGLPMSSPSDAIP